MATEPRFPSKANHPIPARLTTGNTAKDGTGTVVELFSAINNDAAGTGNVDAIVYAVNYIISQTNSVNSVIRLFLNNGGSNATATNNILLCEATVITLTQSETVSQKLYRIDGIKDRIIPAGYRILAAISQTPTNPIACYAWGESYA